MTGELRYGVEAFYRDAVDTEAAWLKDDQIRREFMHLFGQMQALRVRITGIGGQRMVLGPSDGGQIEERSLFDYVNSYSFSITGETNESMRNIIAERVFGMPQ